MSAASLVAIEPLLYRAPLATPIATSFGAMASRPALLVRAVDAAGSEGWGEVWCNFPSCGAEHRARLIATVVAPLLVGREVADPAPLHAELTARLHVLALQSGEPGPLAQVLAGVDLALWDLVARREGVPLWRKLGGAWPRPVPAYASGLGPDGADLAAATKAAEGYRAFKLKVGFGRERDLANLAALRQAVGPAAAIMVDANQAWDLPAAQAMAAAMAEFGPRWLEEPLCVDAPPAEWAALATSSPVPLAGGENLRGADQFQAAIGQGALRVLQPDLGKWGGFSACRTVVAAAQAAGLTYCPHWLGGGIGLMASLHLLSAVGGDGLLEVDANPNPLRELAAQPFPAVADGAMTPPSGPGLGVRPDLAALERYRIPF